MADEGRESISSRLKGPVLSAKGTRQGPPDDLDEGMTQEKLNQLHDLFEEMDEDGGGGLDIDEFKNAMRQTMGNISDKEIELIFMKVDANCDGSVDWDEYLSYMLLEFQEKSQMSSIVEGGLFSPDSFRDLPSNHRDAIIKILFVPNVTNSRGEMLKEIDYSNGRYISAGRDGRVNFWSIEYQQQRSCFIDNLKDVSLWMTDMICLPNINMLACATTDRNIMFYDYAGSLFEKKYEIVQMPFSPLCMDYWFDFVDSKNAIFIIGDDGGNVSVVEFNDIAGGPFGQIQDKLRGAPQVVFRDLLKGKYPTARTKMHQGIHRDWVNQVKYLHDIHCFVSCDCSNDKSMYLGDILGKKANYYFQIQKGVLCFDYCFHNNILVTGGLDHNVRIWNPYMPKRAIAVLMGHLDAVTHVQVYSDRDQVITVSKDRNLRVYDVHDHSCTLNFQLKNFSLISSISFNPKQKVLFVGSNELALFENNQDEELQQRQVSHEAPVTAAIYNSLFNVVVSACQASTIICWNITNGEKVIQFKKAHSQISGDCEEVGVEITCMQFDPSLRRLITGARNGSVKVWNFNNGACLWDVETDLDREITSLCCPRDRILVTGWNRQVLAFVDGEEDLPPKIWDKKHKEDILAVDFYDPADEDDHQADPCIVATSSYDGDIIIWEMETGHMLYRLNANEGLKPQTYFKQKMSKIQSKLTSMSVLSKMSQDLAMQRSNDEKLQEQTIFNKLQGTLTLPQITENQLNVQTRPVISSSVSEGDSLQSEVQKVKNRLGKFRSSAASDEKLGAHAQEHHVAVDKLLFIHSREEGKDTAQLFSSGAHGWVRAWSVHRDGGLLGQFHAAHKPYGESVLAMCCDDLGDFLVTGDTQGYIKVWDISEYCIEDVPEGSSAKRQEKAKSFVYTNLNPPQRQMSGSEKERYEKQYAVPPPESEPHKTHKIPPILNSFRAHMKAVNSVSYCDEQDLLVTASTDCSVRLWTVQGRFIGIFGQKNNWSPNDLEMSPGHRLPDDIRREGSAMTLKVLNAGGNSRWVQRKKTLFMMSRMRLHAKAKKEQERRAAGIDIDDEDATKTADTSDDMSETHIQDRGLNPPVLTNDIDASHSKYLGKTFKAPGKHRAMPKVTIKHIENTCQVQVYPCLRFSDLTKTASTMKTISGIQQKYNLLSYNDRRANNKGVGKGRPMRSMLDTVTEMMSGS
ncbi:WD repeat-containing protein on Y chromosome-like isoform X2 [Watersipora subatra]|uniref:WD repeat-containing protein on Y chromosome-like isoform X2 n=1 Tax=Watersipora subatra TaxID=2589382 RepID=UPI00355C942C